MISNFFKKHNNDYDFDFEKIQSYVRTYDITHGNHINGLIKMFKKIDQEKNNLIQINLNRLYKSFYLSPNDSIESMFLNPEEDEENYSLIVEMFTLSLNLYLCKFPHLSITSSTFPRLDFINQDQFIPKIDDFNLGEEYNFLHPLITTQIYVSRDLNGGEILFFDDQYHLRINNMACIIFPCNFIYNYSVSKVKSGKIMRITSHHF